MKTLEEHNQERAAIYEMFRKAQEARPNGIACPECGKELVDSNPGRMLSSSPPQKNIHCPACNYRGFRLA